MYWQQWIYQQKRRNEGLQRLTKNCLVIISSQEMRKGEKQNQNNPVIPKKKKKSKFYLAKIPKQTIQKYPSILPHCTQQSCGRILSQTWFEIQLCSVITRELQWFVWLMALPEELSGRWPCADRVQGVWGTLCSPNAIFLLCNNISYMTEIRPRGKSTFIAFLPEKYNGKSKLPTYRTKILLVTDNPNLVLTRR